MPERTWSIHRRDSDELVPYHFVLTPVRRWATLDTLRPDEQAGLFEDLQWIRDAYELDGLTVAVPQGGPLVVHVVAGPAHHGTVQLDLTTGELHAKDPGGDRG